MADHIPDLQRSEAYAKGQVPTLDLERTQMDVERSLPPASAEDVRAFCVPRRSTYPSPSQRLHSSIVGLGLLTSFPLCTHRRQGRLLSHRKCFFLQLMHADATCAFVFLVVLGDSCPAPDRASPGEV